VRLVYQYPLGDVRLEPGIGHTYFDPLARTTVSRSASVTIR
jgi:hypothetical protein